VGVVLTSLWELDWIFPLWAAGCLCFVVGYSMVMSFMELYNGAISATLLCFAQNPCHHHLCVTATPTRTLGWLSFAYVLRHRSLMPSYPDQNRRLPEVCLRFAAQVRAADEQPAAVCGHLGRLRRAGRARLRRASRVRVRGGLRGGGGGGGGGAERGQAPAQDAGSARRQGDGGGVCTGACAGGRLACGVHAERAPTLRGARARAR
jgi:hypothetical protein